MLWESESYCFYGKKKESADFERGIQSNQSTSATNLAESNIPTLNQNTIRPLTKDQHFALLLQNEILNNRTTQSTVNSVATSVLEFVKMSCKLDESSEIDHLISISKSSYLQEKKSDEILNFKRIYKENEYNGGKFYVADLRFQIEHVLKKKEIVNELLKDKFGKFWLLLNIFKNQLLIIIILLKEPPSQTVYKSYKESKFYKPTENDKEIMLYIYPYFDEYDSKTGPSKGSNTKMCASYLIIGNWEYYNLKKKLKNNYYLYQEI